MEQIVRQAAAERILHRLLITCLNRPPCRHHTGGMQILLSAFHICGSSANYYPKTVFLPCMKRCDRICSLHAEAISLCSSLFVVLPLRPNYMHGSNGISPSMLLPV